MKHDLRFELSEKATLQMVYEGENTCSASVVSHLHANITLLLRKLNRTPLILNSCQNACCCVLSCIWINSTDELYCADCSLRNIQTLTDSQWTLSMQLYWYSVVLHPSLLPGVGALAWQCQLLSSPLPLPCVCVCVYFHDNKDQLSSQRKKKGCMLRTFFTS